ncbi:GNAT family N-acetyltransferase [Microbacteriaceae bacterium VKM Ac-2854]|nr:GNAT family N-acetyltransferase [Microbacteriaceae bacterium VKM Ac-2854]
MSPVLVRELPIPAHPGAPGWADFVAAMAIGNDVEAEQFGTRDLAYPPEVDLAEFQLQAQEPRRAFVAEADGRMLGLGRIEWTLEDDDDAVWISVRVEATQRGRGVGRALTARLVAVARELGRPVVQTWTANPVPFLGPELAPASGAGSIDSSSAGVRALLADDWTLEQVERVSRIELPIEVAAPVVDAYDTVTWLGPTPGHWERDIAALHSAISVDAPSAGLSAVAENWSIEHLRARDAMHNTTGMTELTVAARHRASGRLVGYSSLDLFDDRRRPALQNDTVVLAEHRGHRLGMRLKQAGFALLQSTAPECRAIYTWNAEENRPMLRVNEEVGFVAVAVEGLWKKVLA